MAKKNKEPKLDFGPTKEEHGWFYYVWNWKTYVFYAFLAVAGTTALFEGGIGAAIGTVVALYVLRFLSNLY